MSLKSLLPLAVFALVVSAPSTRADEQVQLFKRYEFFAQTSGGEPALCGTEFTYLFKDWLYAGGALEGVQGSLSFAGITGKLIAILKLRGFTSLEAGIEKAGHFPIDSASVKTGDKYFRFARGKCETETDQYCGSIGGNDGATLAAVAGNGQTWIVFNQSSGSLDYEFRFSAEPNAGRNPLNFFKARHRMRNA